MSSGPGSRPFSLRRRNSSTSTEKEKSGSPMDSGQGQPSGFNRRRAEGRDKDSRKNLQLKMRKLNPINTLCYAQILGTGMDTQDTSPSVLLFFDKQRFIFNAGEGLQRFCTEHKIKLLITYFYPVSARKLLADFQVCDTTQPIKVYTRRKKAIADTG
ncbi:hypothetical protein OROHE_009504 [Orobanche hederae]